MSDIIREIFRRSPLGGGLATVNMNLPGQLGMGPFPFGPDSSPPPPTPPASPAVPPAPLRNLDDAPPPAPRPVAVTQLEPAAEPKPHWAMPGTPDAERRRNRMVSAYTKAGWPEQTARRLVDNYVRLHGYAMPDAAIDRNLSPEGQERMRKNWEEQQAADRRHGQFADQMAAAADPGNWEVLADGTVRPLPPVETTLPERLQNMGGRYEPQGNRRSPAPRGGFAQPAMTAPSAELLERLERLTPGGAARVLRSGRWTHEQLEEYVSQLEKEAIRDTEARRQGFAGMADKSASEVPLRVQKNDWVTSKYLQNKEYFDAQARAALAASGVANPGPADLQAHAITQLQQAWDQAMVHGDHDLNPATPPIGPLAEGVPAAERRPRKNALNDMLVPARAWQAAQRRANVQERARLYHMATDATGIPGGGPGGMGRARIAADIGAARTPAERAAALAAGAALNPNIVNPNLAALAMRDANDAAAQQAALDAAAAGRPRVGLEALEHDRNQIMAMPPGLDQIGRWNRWFDTSNVHLGEQAQNPAARRAAFLRDFEGHARTIASAPEASPDQQAVVREWTKEFNAEVGFGAQAYRTWARRLGLDPEQDRTKALWKSMTDRAPAMDWMGALGDLAIGMIPGWAWLNARSKGE